MPAPTHLIEQQLIASFVDARGKLPDDEAVLEPCALLVHLRKTVTGGGHGASESFALILPTEPSFARCALQAILHFQSVTHAGPTSQACEPLELVAAEFPALPVQGKYSNARESASTAMASARISSPMGPT